jgi:hypothetical protein
MKKALILLTLSFVSLGSLHAQRCSDSDKLQFNAPTAGFKNRLPYPYLIFIKTSFPLWDEMQGKLHVLTGFGI